MPTKPRKDGLQLWTASADWKRRVKAVCKPCWELKYCPYGPLVEHYPLGEDSDERTCRIFGHHCPVFYAAEPFTETRTLRNISRNIPRPVQFRVLKRDNQICAVCGHAVLDANIHFDHIIPWSKGGPTEEHNIRLLCDSCNRKKGAQFETDNLVTSFTEHALTPMDAGFADLLRTFVRDAHSWRTKHGHLPTAVEVCTIVGVRKVSAFEERMAEVLVDMDTLFSGPAPKEIAPRVFRALADRWGFARDGKVKKLAVASRASKVELTDLITAEIALIRRFGWPVKDTPAERRKWGRL